MLRHKAVHGIIGPGSAIRWLWVQTLAVTQILPVVLAASRLALKVYRVEELGQCLDTVVGWNFTFSVPRHAISVRQHCILKALTSLPHPDVKIRTKRLLRVL